MKTNQMRGRHGCTLRAGILSAVTCMALAVPAYAQTPDLYTHEFPQDVKHYSTVTIASDGQALMAGTTFNNVGPNGAGQGEIHLIRTENDATIDMLGSSWRMYDNAFDDTRTVALVANTNISNRYYIVAKARPNRSVAGALPATDRDMIRIVQTTNNPIGGTLNAAYIYENTSINPSGYRNSMYPTDAVYRYSGGRDLLYICGYFSPDDTRNSTTPQPDYSHRKEAFVISVDVTNSNPAAWAVVGKLFFNYTPIMGAQDNIDYDIAMRIFVTAADKIFVTGSTNARTGTAPGTGFPQRSATMNLLLEPQLDLHPTPIIVNNPFISLSNIDGYGGYEFGSAFYEDPVNNVKYIAGSYFQSYGGYSSPLDPVGFDYLHSFLHITELDNAYNYTDRLISSSPPAPPPPPVTLSHAATAIVSSILPSDISPAPGNTRFLLTGMMGSIANCVNNSPSGIGPFVFDLELTPGAAPLSWVLTGSTPSTFAVYGTAAGVGFSNINNYITLGGGLSYPLWLPRMWDKAYPASGNPLLVFNAPRGINNKLGLKTFLTQDPGTQYFETPCPFESPLKLTCIPDHTQALMENPMVNKTSRVPSLTIASKVITVNDFFQLTEENCTVQYKNGTTGVTGTAQRAHATAIYPNPAVTHINVSLAKDIKADAQVEVVLTNIQGQVVSRLYKGIATGLTPATALQLPQVATGLYIVQVYSNDAMVHQQKLSIQQ